jgi:hypothetical protein
MNRKPHTTVVITIARGTASLGLRASSDSVEIVSKPRKDSASMAAPAKSWPGSKPKS